MYSQHPYLHHLFIPLKVSAIRDKIVLDIGCGRGVFGYILRAEKGGTYARQLVGLDANIDYLRFTKKYQVYDDVILATANVLPFKEKSIDLVLAIEVLEHIPKQSGYEFLRELNRVCANKTVLTTPNGFLPSPKASSLYEEHKSGWTLAELRKEGFIVNGFGFRYYHGISRLSQKAAEACDIILTPLAFVLPALGRFFLAMKESREK